MKRNIKIYFGLCVLFAVVFCLFSVTSLEKYADPPELGVKNQPSPYDTTANNTISGKGQGVSENASEGGAPSLSDRPVATEMSTKQAEIRKQTTKEYTYRILAAPNDPSYAGSWSLQKMNASSAWDMSTGGPQAVIAVIDSGFALSHEDLVNNWYINSGETGTTSPGEVCWTGSPSDKQVNGCDDDSNGYIDDYRGWNFYSVSNLPQAGLLNPTGVGVSHGTNVAGIAGAKGNNSKGNTSLNWNAKIMPLQALNDNGIGYTSDIAAAMYYAVDNGASVINLSLGGDSFDQTIKNAVLYAHSHSVIVVAAAGNCGTGTESGCENLAPGSMAYPATEQYVVSVGATTQADQRASFSSYGPKLDLVAPGSGSMVAPRWSQGNQTSAYTSSLTGTSFAAPQVTSLVSLIKSMRPGTNTEDITALLLATTTKIGDLNSQLYNNQLGHGLINAAQALTVANSLNSGTVTPELAQVGGYQGEHFYSANEWFGSRCKTQASSYCTIRFSTDSSGFERYLPYQLTNSSGETSWSWFGSQILGTNSWNIRAAQGQSLSTTPYNLSIK